MLNRYASPPLSYTCILSHIIILAVTAVEPAPASEGGAGMSMPSAGRGRSRALDPHNITFSIAITKLQEVKGDGSVVASYDLKTANLTAEQHIYFLSFLFDFVFFYVFRAVFISPIFF